MRIKSAMEKHEYWCHLLLTFYQRRKSVDGRTFRQGLQCWDKLRKRLQREYGKILYIQTWEIHRTGFPHVHVAISNARLFHLAKGDKEYNFDTLIQSHAVSSGFGDYGGLSPLRDMDALCGYLSGLAKELVGGNAKNQVPVNAPRHFRRLRASVGLLEKRHKNEDYTGQLRKFPAPPESPPE